MHLSPCIHMYICTHPHLPVHTHTHTHPYTESVQPVLETEHRATSTNITNGILIHITQWTMTVMKEGHQWQHKIYSQLMIVTLMQDKMTKFTFSIMFTHLQKIRFFEEINTPESKRVRVCVCVRVQVHVCVCVCVRACACACTHARMWKHSCTYEFLNKYGL